MSDASALEDRRLQGEIDALRVRFIDTQELYREVCTLLFFRHGITPTANKLYQLVRKGSMSAPSEALARFWETLRDKSRVRIEHPDLPNELRDAAGEVIGALWQRAQALAQDSLAASRSEAQANVLAAQAATEAAEAQTQELRLALDEARTQLREVGARLQSAGQDLAREQGETTALRRQVDDGAQQRRELQDALQAAQQGFTHELEQQRSVAAAAEERYNADLRRALLDVDRERSAATKAQKELEQARRAGAEQVAQHRSSLETWQQERAQLSQKLGVTEGALAETRAARDALSRQLEKALLAKTRPATPRRKPGSS